MASLCRSLLCSKDTDSSGKAKDKGNINFSSTNRREKIVCTQPTRRGSELLPVSAKEDGCQESSETSVQTIQPNKGTWHCDMVAAGNSQKVFVTSQSLILYGLKNFCMILRTVMC